MEFLPEIKKSKLFAKMNEQEIRIMLACLNARTIKLKKGGILIHRGDKVEFVGIVLCGVLHIIKEDADGERTLVAQLTPGEHFAEALCCAGINESPVSITAETDANILLIDFKRILHICTNACEFHAKLIENMLHVMAVKNVQMQERIEYISKKTIRKRILKYLSNFPASQGQTFTIPLNREELADYLCIDRSALSRELMRLKEEHILDYWKNQFKLL